MYNNELCKFITVIFITVELGLLCYGSTMLLAVTYSSVWTRYNRLHRCTDLYTYNLPCTILVHMFIYSLHANFSALLLFIYAPMTTTTATLPIQRVWLFTFDLKTCSIEFPNLLYENKSDDLGEISKACMVYVFFAKDKKWLILALICTYEA